MKLQELLQNPKYKQKFVLEKLIQEYLGFDRATMRVHLDQEIPSEQLEIIQTAYQSYIEEKKPLEYILGHVDFFGVPFYVNEHTLIPRPETEYMITAVTEYITSLHKEKNETKDAQNNILLDIGTGCGVLGISVLLQNPNRFREIFFSDISEEALKVAQQNYKKLITNSYNTHFLQANLADFLHNTSLRGETQSEAKGSDEAIQTNSRLLRSARNDNIILVANLPYIPDETFDNNALENVQKWEPRLAFVGGDDGLDLYREMFNQMLPLYNKKTENANNKQGELIMFLEMMTRQVEILRQEFGNRLKFEEVKTFHFNIRIVKARIK